MSGLSEILPASPRYITRDGRQYAEYPDGYVYFARLRSRSALVKIGWSQNPRYRMEALKQELRDHPSLLRVVRVRRGSRLFGVGRGSLERKVHYWARERSEGGELFRLTDEDTEELAEWAEYAVLDDQFEEREDDLAEA